MKHFTLKELCHSNVADVRRIENKPDAAQEKALTALVDIYLITRIETKKIAAFVT